MAIKEKAGRKARLYINSMEKYVSMLSDKGIRVVVGHAPATDGKGTIYLPNLPEEATPEQKIQYLAYAMHEQAHFHGKSDPSKMPSKKMWHFCINAVDDIRVERLQEVAYPGIPDTRRHAYQLDMDMFLSKELLDADAKDKPRDFLITLLKYMIIKIRVQQMKAPISVIGSKDILDYYAKYLMVFESRLDYISTFQESMDLGTEIYGLLKDILKEALTPPPPPKPEPPKPEEASDDDEGDKSEDDKSEDNNENDEKSEEDDNEEDDKSEEDESDDESEEDSGDEEDDKSEDDEEGSRAKSDDEESDDDEEDKSEEAIDLLEDMNEGGDDIATLADKYKDALEGMVNGDDYAVKNGVVDDISYNTELDHNYVDRGKALLGVAGAQMTRVFISKSRESVDFNQRRGRFDMKAFISDASDQRRDVFSNVKPGGLDKAAVSFAIDNSGSMLDYYKIHKAYEILGGILYYLDKAGVPTEAAGFTATKSTSEVYRTGAVTIKVVKTFDESFKGKALLRCHPPSYMDLTIELECLKFLAPRLYKRPEGKKVLFVLSDGDPWAGDPALTDKLKVAYVNYIKMLRDAGIIVIGFGIDTDVTTYFGTDCINTSCGNLGEEIVKKLSEILNRR